MNQPLTKTASLSILIPVYNEEAIIEERLRRVATVPLELRKEIVVVDDGSQDQTLAAIERSRAANPEFAIQL